MFPHQLLTRALINTTQMLQRQNIRPKINVGHRLSYSYKQKESSLLMTVENVFNGLKLHLFKLQKLLNLLLFNSLQSFSANNHSHIFKLCGKALDVRSS